MNLSYSLHKITSNEHFTFSPINYSWFKFGDKNFAKLFAEELFNNFILEHKDLILSQDEIIILPSPYLSIPTASNFLCKYFKDSLNIFLFENKKKAVVESKIFRNQTYTTDYGNLNFEDRIKLISGDTYYIDQKFISNKFCLFIDDIKITGSHEFTVNKILNQYNVNGTFLFVYYAELINNRINPNIENKINYSAVKSINEIIEVVNRINFQYNTRIVKFILNLKMEDFSFFLNNIDIFKQQELFNLSLSNNYHQIEEYNRNLLYLRENLRENLYISNIKR